MKLNEDLLMEAVKNAKDTTYLTHNYHPFPAKFIPHLPQILIKQFSSLGDKVLDPFSGSGTTLVEAMLLGRHSIGTDINPISVLASNVKTSPLSGAEIELIENCLTELEQADTAADYTKHIPEFHGRDHWFMPHVQNELAMLRLKITTRTKSESNTRHFLDLAFSSIVNLVSNQDSDTRYAAVEKNVPVGKPTKLLIQRASAMLERMKAFVNKAHDVTTDARLADSRQLDFIEDVSIDLLVTSPPYANTYDYYLYHKHRMNWLGLNWKGAMDDEIGSRNKHSSKKEEIDTYIDDMQQSFVQFARVMKPGAYAIFIIGDSVIRDVLHKADDIVRNIAEPLGFEWVDCITYDLGLASKMFSRSFRRTDKEEHIILLRRQG